MPPFSTSLNKSVSSVIFGGTISGHVLLIIKVPPRSKALVLDFEGIKNVPVEEEVLLAPGTNIRINSIKKVRPHYELELTVVN